MHDVELRPAARRDAPAIARMARDHVEYGLPWRWRPERIRACLEKPERAVLGAYRGTRLVGFAVVDFGRTDAHLLLLAVLPRYRRQGLATAMLAWAEASMRTAGLARIWVQLRTRNAAGRAFYRSLGFRDVDVARGYYDGIEDAYRMVRELTVSGVRGPAAFAPESLSQWRFRPMAAQPPEGSGDGAD